MLYVIERPPQHMAVSVNCAVFDRQEALGVFSSHSKEGRNPHPEQRPRSAGYDSRRDTHNIPRANGRRQGGAQRSKAADLTAASLLVFHHVLQRFW